MPIKVTMPALSPTMTDGTLAKWLKKEGDKVKAGDVIAEIETDKATMEVEAVDEGILGKILVKAGTEKVLVNTTIALLLEEGEDKKALDNFKDTAPASNVAAATPSQASSSSPSPQRPVASSGISTNKKNRIFASPLAKRMAFAEGIDLKILKGSGPHGRIVKADVERGPVSAASVAAAPTKPKGPDAKQLSDLLGMKYKEIPNNNIKKVTAERLLESKQTVPHFYLTVECALDNLLAHRKKLNADGKNKISVNDFVIKAVANALKDYPAANVAWTDAAVLQYLQSDISVAVSTPNGLITPIIKGAESKGLAQISNEMKDLATRAREGKLKPTEFQGGTFSVSNLGMFGVMEFSAIINPPQACILAVGAGVERAVVEEGKVVVRTIMHCTLSTDHRAVDGAVGAEFLQHFKKYIENPNDLQV